MVKRRLMEGKETEVISKRPIIKKEEFDDIISSIDLKNNPYLTSEIFPEKFPTSNLDSAASSQKSSLVNQLNGVDNLNTINGVTNNQNNPGYCLNDSIRSEVSPCTTSISLNSPAGTFDSEVFNFHEKAHLQQIDDLHLNRSTSAMGCTTQDFFDTKNPLHDFPTASPSDPVFTPNTSEVDLNTIKTIKQSMKSTSKIISTFTTLKTTYLKLCKEFNYLLDKFNANEKIKIELIHENNELRKLLNEILTEKELKTRSQQSNYLGAALKH